MIGPRVSLVTKVATELETELRQDPRRIKMDLAIYHVVNVDSLRISMSALW